MEQCQSEQSGSVYRRSGADVVAVAVPTVNPLL